MERDIITIDHDKCTGCGLCIPGCPEGALQLIDGKARLVSDLMCDGLGACIGECPEGAITIERREAEPYDEAKVMDIIIPQGKAVIQAHLDHLADHGEDDLLAQARAILAEKGMSMGSEPRAASGTASATERASHGHVHQGHVHGPKSSPPAGFGGCPGSLAQLLEGRGAPQEHPRTPPSDQPRQTAASTLGHWPVQLHLASPRAPHYRGSDLLLAADCVAYAMGDFHSSLLDGKTLAIACPKLDSGRDVYLDKLVAFIDDARVDTITVAIMEVPCCGGLVAMVKEALSRASRKVPIKRVLVGIRGQVLDQEWL